MAYNYGQPQPGIGVQQQPGMNQQQPGKGTQQQNPPPNMLQNLLGQLIGQAQPQSMQPQGFGQEFGNLQMGHLQSLQPGMAGQRSPIEEDEMRRFQNEVIPQLEAQYGRGPGQSGAFLNKRMGAETDLASRMAAQRAQREDQRTGQRGQFLTGQQNLGQQQQELGQRGLFGMMGQATNRDQLDLSTILDALKTEGSLGIGQGGDTEKERGLVEQLIKALGLYAGTRKAAGGGY